MTVLGTAAAARALKWQPALGRATSVLLGATVAVDAAFVIGLLLSSGVTSPFVNVGLSLATQWIPVSVFWVVAARTGFRRPPVVLAAAAVTFSAIGDAYYSLAMDAGGYLPFPSPADAGYLLFYPLMVAALLALVGRRFAGVGRLVLIETAAATAGASAVLAVILGPVIDNAMSGDAMLDNAIAVAYPLFDLVLLAVVAGIASVPSIRVGGRWWALIAGLVTFAVADVAYALLEGFGTYIAGTPLDATWTVGLAFLTWWVAAAPTAQTGPVSASLRPSAFPLPAIAVVAGLAVLVIGTRIELSLPAVVLATLTVALGAVPIIFRQAVLGRLVAAQEESVRRLTELDQAKTDILVTVNHEFRTPLTSITGHVELLLDGGAGPLPPEAVPMLETIERNGARLQALIDESFAAARFTSAPAVDAPASIDLPDLVARAVAHAYPAASRRRIELTLTNARPGVVIDGDGAHLERAVGNLLDNAVKFTGPEGHVAVTVDAPAGDDVVITIRDDGMGIPEVDQPRLFTRFMRGSNVKSAAIPGIGLGLSIAQQVVSAHGGSIAVDSSEGRGTTMTIRLPVRRGRRRLPRLRRSVRLLRGVAG